MRVTPKVRNELLEMMKDNRFKLKIKRIASDTFKQVIDEERLGITTPCAILCVDHIKALNKACYRRVGWFKNEVDYKYIGIFELTKFYLKEGIK